MRLSSFLKRFAPLALVGCGASPGQSAALDTTLAPVVLAGEPAAAAPLPLESPTVTLQRELCRRAVERGAEGASGEPQTKCVLAKVRDVGDQTYVALLYRGSEEWKADGSSAAELGMTSEGDTDSFGVDFSSCKPFEYWLASVADGKLARAQLITEICNDGHGAAGIGEDSVTVSADAIVVATNGGSAWRWGHRDTFSLPELTPLSEAFDGYWSVSTNTSHGQWSWTERKGEATWEAPRCDPGQADPPPVGFSFDLMPSFDSVPALAGEAWKSVSSIEGCATTLESDASAESAKLVLLAADDQLFVEIRDDKLITDGNLRDELEVWHRLTASGDWSQHCLEAPAPASGTAIRMGDLSTRLLGSKTGKPLVVERAPGSGSAPLRLRVSLPAKTAAVTVVYRDTDDGKRRSLVVSSSTFDAKDDATLGSFQPVTADRASCELVGDSLSLRMKVHAEPDRPITRF